MGKKEIKEISLIKVRKIVKSILSETSRTTKIIADLHSIIKYKDVLFYTWQTLMKILLRDKCSNSVYLLNVFELLQKIVPPKATRSSETTEYDKEIIGFTDGNNKFVLDMALLKKIIGKVWQSLINRDLTPEFQQKLLFLLLESYLSNIDNPIFLTDFFMASMNLNGIVSILALEGMSQLMQKHNIEYPNMYGKLYTMFQPDIFHKKFKSRLFHLADIFLSSLYLPEIIVASFAKRAARLSLTCSAPDIPMILRFIGNLLIRHPGLRSMIHHSDGFEVLEDPFLMNESDPTKTNATKSSLWEISILKKHCLPSISSAAKYIDFNLPSMEFDLDEVLGKTYKDIFESECKKKKMEKPSLTFERPQSTIAQLKDDKLYKTWLLYT